MDLSWPGKKPQFAWSPLVYRMEMDNLCRGLPRRASQSERDEPYTGMKLEVDVGSSACVISNAALNVPGIASYILD